MLDTKLKLRNKLVEHLQTQQSTPVPDLRNLLYYDIDHADPKTGAVVRYLASPDFNAQTMCGTLCLQHKVNEAQHGVSAEFNRRIQEIFESAIQRKLVQRLM